MKTQATDLETMDLEIKIYIKLCKNSCNLIRLPNSEQYTCANDLKVLISHGVRTTRMWVNRCSTQLVTAETGMEIRLDPHFTFTGMKTDRWGPTGICEQGRLHSGAAPLKSVFRFLS